MTGVRPQPPAWGGGSPEALGGSGLPVPCLSRGLSPTPGLLFWGMRRRWHLQEETEGSTMHGQERQLGRSCTPATQVALL